MADSTKATTVNAPFIGVDLSPIADSRKPLSPRFGFGTSTRWHRMSPILKS
jgi:hypothetical protein